ncbi:MAG: outer membrane beta-barrel protein, partial [Bacteroidia bacterium]|nr:outer membrane beta-barrel protein [Bacteroidia bacterium]
KEYFTLNNNYNGGVSLSSNISEKIDFNIGPNLTYAQIISNGLKTTATNYYITQVSGKAQWIFYKGFFIHANGTYYNYQGLGAGYNVNYALLNGGVGAKFFKNNSGELRLMIFDILNQNNSINRTTTETYTEDSKNLVLKRYYMLTFTYTFKKFSVGSQPPEADKPPFPMPGGGFPFPGGGGPPHGSHP